MGFYDIDEDEYEEWVGDDDFDDYEDGECPDCDGLGEIRYTDPITGDTFWLDCDYCAGLGFLY